MPTYQLFYLDADKIPEPNPADGVVVREAVWHLADLPPAKSWTRGLVKTRECLLYFLPQENFSSSLQPKEMLVNTY